MTSAIDDSQASLALTVFIQQSGTFPSHDGAGATFLGQLGIFAGTFSPNGALLAQGQTLSINQNQALFSLLGTTYGGNGFSNFALPNLSGSALIGSGTGAGLAPQSLGVATGSSGVTLSTGQLPPTLGGTSQPFSNYQPSLPLSYIILTEGTFPSNDGGNDSGQNDFIGIVVPWAGDFAPTGDWHFADGSLLPIAGNNALYQVLGTTYGGNGVTTFALPDLRGRDIVGASASHPVGQSFGQPSVSLANAQVPATPGASAQPFDNEQPSLAMNYLIATRGIFSSSSGGGSLDDGQATIGHIVAFAGNFAPEGWALANGQLLLKSQYPELFNIIGTTYGGDGVTNFALPDLRDRTVVGTSAGHPFATTFGSNSETINASQVPPTVTINRDPGQSDPTSSGPIVYDVVFSVPVTGFDGSDISFAGSTVAGTLSAGVTGSGASYTVSVNGMVGNGTLVAAIPAGAAFDQGGAPSIASTSADNAVDVVCFLRGTRIRTPDGSKPVELLLIGDKVLTADGGTRDVRWLWRQTVVSRFADELRAYPIRIMAGALGENVPQRDLFLSPDHAILINECLVQAAALVNNTTVTRVRNPEPRFVYYHIELEDHALVLAEGVASETFVDNVTRRNFDNHVDYTAFYGAGEVAIVEMKFPRVKSARQLPRVVRARLAARAAALCVELREAA